MQHTVIVVAGALLSVAAGPLAAQGSGCARNPAEAERQLRQLEDDWNRAGTARDGAFFERLLASDFVAVAGADVRTKADVIAGVVGTTDGPRRPATLSATRVRLLGDVAVVTGLSSYDETPPRRVRYTEVFACRDGRWQAVHGHYSDIRPETTDSARVAPPPDSILVAAETAQRAGRGTEARAILERGARSATAADRRLFHRGLVGDSHLHDGDVAGARAAYEAMLREATAARVDSMANWAHYGMALADAFDGRADDAERHLAQSVRLGGWTGADTVVDRIVVLAAAGRVERTLALLATLEATGPREAGTAGSPQFVHAFRGYALARGGRCDEALRAVARAPQQDRPLLHAVRATCAARAGRRDEALAARARVLDGAWPDPYSWPYIVARHAARQVR